VAALTIPFGGVDDASRVSVAPTPSVAPGKAMLVDVVPPPASCPFVPPALTTTFSIGPTVDGGAYTFPLPLPPPHEARASAAVARMTASR
jgi:hypothetical protein